MSIYQGDQKVANVYNINNNSYSMPIGCIIPFSGNTIPIGFLLCDGSEVSKTTYADLYKVIGNIYGTATDTTKFKLPDLRDRFVQGANGNLGTSKDAGLPNITGKFYQDRNATSGISGVFTYETGNHVNLANDKPTNSGFVVFNASKSNPIYGNSNTVQPPSVCLTFIIKAEKISDQYAAEVSALIDDSVTDATNKTWSAKKINNAIKEIYSSDEIKTNKIWVDNKPIYRKIYMSSDFDFIDSAQQGTSKTNIPNIEDLVNISGRCKETTYFVPLNIGKWRGDTLGNWSFSALVRPNGQIILDMGSSVYSAKGNIKVCVEYTKTTD